MKIDLNIDHKIIAKHFKKSIQAMWKLKNRYKSKESNLWEVYIKAYNYDLLQS